MKIENINTGICHSRAQLNQPCFFVNWRQDGKNEYKFFTQRFMLESFKNNLKMEATKEIKQRLEQLRQELRNECISYSELIELQSLVEYIEPGDVELLEAAGVPENN